MIKRLLIAPKIFSSKTKKSWLSSVNNLLELNYGVSNSFKKQDPRQFINVQDIKGSNEAIRSQNVWIRGRISAVRTSNNSTQGSGMCFVVIRDNVNFSIQCCQFLESRKKRGVPNVDKTEENFLAFMNLVNHTPKESVVEIYGKVLSLPEKSWVRSCSQSDVELHIEKFYICSKAPSVLPFTLQDAATASDSEVEITNHEPVNGSPNQQTGFSVGQQSLRLDNRWIDLRVPANNAVFRVKSHICQLFREFLTNFDTIGDFGSFPNVNKSNFVEIHTPKLLPGASEGGSDVFSLKFFDRDACLAQSPQLYKQMAISCDLRRVFEVAPVFRAEQSHTRRHLCEFIGLDIEMEIYDHYNEVLHVLHHLLRFIFTGLEGNTDIYSNRCQNGLKRFNSDVQIVRDLYRSTPLKIPKDPLIIHWPDAIKMLQNSGVKIEDEFGDLTSAQELLLGEIVLRDFDSDLFIVDQYPTKIRPFYTMVNPENPLYSNSYDVFLRGQEICSGAQRCHDAEKLKEQMRQKNLNTELFTHYLRSFEHGIAPHGGAGLGLERLVFLYLQLENIRKASLFPRYPVRLHP